MSSEYRDAVDGIQAALRPWLAARRFRSRGRTFNRLTADGLTQVINLQMGSFDPPGTTYIPGLRENLHGLFTVNLGVHVPEVALHHGGGPPRAWIQDYHCAIRARLGEVCGAPDDQWWPATAVPEVVEQVRSGLEVGGLPWLDRFGERRSILAELRDPSAERWGGPPRIVMAIILVAMGDGDGAKTLLTTQASDPDIQNRSPRHAEYVRELALKLGLGVLDA